MTTNITTDPGTVRGASNYNGLRLLTYDYIVLGLFNRFVWHCPTTTHLLPLFQSGLGASHLDIGVATGWYTQTAHLPPSTTVSLCDLSPTALAAAERRIAPAHRGEIILANILEPLPAPTTRAGPFDSASAFFLLHCLPGPPAAKTGAIAHIARALRPGAGVCTGATILGPGRGGEPVEGWLTRLARAALRKRGVTDNEEDSPEVFEEALKREFRDVETWVVGCVFLWRATGPTFADREGEEEGAEQEAA
jgi:SAM-dependent methyltransferase